MRVSERELARWGRRIGASVHPPLFLALRGELGAGKSVLARAVARGAGVEGSIPSPTFNLLFRYEGRDGLVVTHLDLYRLERADELWELGWDELGGDNEVVMVEWAGRAEAMLPRDRWDIELSLPPDAAELRDVAVRRVGTPGHLPGFPIDVTTDASDR